MSANNNYLSQYYLTKKENEMENMFKNLNIKSLDVINEENNYEEENINYDEVYVFNDTQFKLDT